MNACNADVTAAAFEESPIALPDVQGSDTTKADSSKKAGQQNKISKLPTNLPSQNPKLLPPNLKRLTIFVLMQVTNALIDKLANLSMLQFDTAEKERLKSDLEKMIGFIDKLQELDTTGVEPLMHMSDAVNVLRPDVPGEMLSVAEALRNAPHHNGQYFQVPKVIKK